MYTLEDKEFEFGRITTADALKCRTAIVALSQNIQDNEANATIEKIARKYLRVKDEQGKWWENPNDEALEVLFENPFATFEIINKYQEYVLGFLNALPSFQQAQARA